MYITKLDIRSSYTYFVTFLNISNYRYFLYTFLVSKSSTVIIPSLFSTIRNKTLCIQKLQAYMRYLSKTT